ncbi:hypothetical protein E4T56_gene19770, partial [Termitomyces sp. T112]
MVICGDPKQVDLPGGMAASGLNDAVVRLEGVEGIATVRFKGSDVYLSIAACFALIPAEAAMATPAITYDCDTAASHFSELVLPAPAGSFTVTGQLQVNQLPPFDKFAPITRLMVVPGNIVPGGSVADTA